MIDELVDYKTLTNEQKEKLKTNIIESKDARLLYLYLHFTSGEDIENISKLILDTHDLRYIRFMLREFKIGDYSLFIDYILKENDNPGYLYYILYDIDYLSDEVRIRIIDKLIELGDIRFTIKALYYYFVILGLYSERLFNTMKELIESNMNVIIDKDNFHAVLDEAVHREDYTVEVPNGFSNNCIKGHNGHIPSIIVCHINNTYGIALKKFYDKSSDGSAHFLIRRDGLVKEIVSLDDSSWGNGTSLSDTSDVYYRFSTSKLVRDTKDNANHYTFSIEHESFDGSLTEEQFNATIGVMKTIIKYLKDKYDYDFIIDRDHIIGHDEVAPIVRTKDPGEKFPYDRIISELRKIKTCANVKSYYRR